jgi:hypothetical protein
VPDSLTIGARPEQASIRALRPFPVRRMAVEDAV